MEKYLPYIIQWMGLFFTFVFYGMGYAFDQRYARTEISGVKNGRAFWGYIAHSLGELGSLSAYVFFCMVNPSWGFLPYLGVIAFCAGTFLMGYKQSRNKPGRDWRWIGDGKESNVEYIFRVITWLLNLPQNIYLKIKKKAAPLYFTMANVSAPIRIGLCIYSLINLI